MEKDALEILSAAEITQILSSACSVRTHTQDELASLVEWAGSTRVASSTLELVLSGDLSISLSDDGVPVFKTIEGLDGPEEEKEEEAEYPEELDKLFDLCPNANGSPEVMHLHYAIEGYTYRVTGGDLSDRPYHPGGARDNSWSAGWRKADLDIRRNPKINER